ncbi:MAG: YegP family protein [Mycobacterium sp.]
MSVGQKRQHLLGVVASVMPDNPECPNGEIIAASQGYETKASAEKGVEAIKTHATSAKVEDHSEAKSS